MFFFFYFVIKISGLQLNNEFKANNSTTPGFLLIKYFLALISLKPFLF